MEKYFILYFICFLINIFSSTQKFESFPITINPNITEKGGYFIKDNNTEHYCPEWFPSLFMPILMIPDKIDIGTIPPIHDSEFELKIPMIEKNRNYRYKLFEKIKFLRQDYTSILMQQQYSKNDLCYLGIASGVDNYQKIEEKQVILNALKEEGLIDKKIFSFDIWDIKSDPKTMLFFGDSHDVFNSNNGMIGTCERYPKDSLWGCSFKEMLFNNINIPLNNGTENLYKIYFSTETHNLIFPIEFQNIFNIYTNSKCFYNSKSYLTCEGFFDSSGHVPLQLTEANDNFVITGEVDNVIRFNQNNDEKKDDARIQFEDIDYIILPLIVFKEFHVQFDAEDNLIKFYTNNPNILKVKEKRNNKSSGLTAFIVILIILLVLGLCLVGYLFIRNKRRTEKNINKFSKFEDEEDYKTINEKKVF